MPTTRTSVFISYSHADERWRQLVEKHLAPLRRDHHIRIWSDQNLLEGEPWLDRIRRELATAKVGILLISANFMASDFIHSDELPPLLAAAKKEGVTLLSVMVGYCHFAGSPLSRLQAFNKPDRPLSALTPPQRDKEMARLCARLLKLFGLRPGAGVGNAKPLPTPRSKANPESGGPARVPRSKAVVAGPKSGARLPKPLATPAAPAGKARKAAAPASGAPPKAPKVENSAPVAAPAPAKAASPRRKPPPSGAK